MSKPLCRNLQKLDENKTAKLLLKATEVETSGRSETEEIYINGRDFFFLSRPTLCFYPWCFPLKSAVSHYLCLALLPSRLRRRWRGRSPRWLSMTSSTSQTTTARASPPRYWTSFCGLFFFLWWRVDWLQSFSKRALLSVCSYDPAEEEPKDCRSLRTLAEPVTSWSRTVITSQQTELLLERTRHFITSPTAVCKCVCVCVWERERESRWVIVHLYVMVPIFQLHNTIKVRV